MKLKILGATWTVHEVTKEALHKVTTRLGITNEDSKEEDFACWDDIEQAIWIRNDIPPESMQEKLHHEIGEAIMHELNISFSDYSFIKEDDASIAEYEHLLYTIYSRVFFATLQDNGFVNIKAGKKKK